MINILRIFKALCQALEPKAAAGGDAVSAPDAESTSKDSTLRCGDLVADAIYCLANQAYNTLPALLARDFGVVLDEPLRRDWLTDAEGRDLEVNILGRGHRGGESVWVIGESKVQLSANDVDRFLRRRVEPLRPVCGAIFPVLVAHMVTARDVPGYAREKGVALYLSYQLQRVRPEPQAA